MTYFIQNSYLYYLFSLPLSFLLLIVYSNEEDCHSVIVHKGDGGFGFSLSGNAPVYIRSVDTASAAARAGVEPGDFIIGINNEDVR